MYIVSEFCHGGTLFELLHETKIPVLWANKVSIAKQIAKGMLFLHSNQPPTIHRDLKSLKYYEVNPASSLQIRTQMRMIKSASKSETSVFRERWLRIL
jgi:serine/threonine protein kinase